MFSFLLNLRSENGYEPNKITSKNREQKLRNSIAGAFILISFKKSFRFLFQVMMLIVATNLYLPAWGQDVSVNKDDSNSLDKSLDLFVGANDEKMIRDVTLVLMPADVLFRFHLDERRLKERGCIFFTDNSEHIADILNILKSSDIKIIENTDRNWEGESREGIFLTFNDGLVVKFLFGQTFSNRDNVRGAFLGGQDEKRQSVTANQLLPDRLSKWGVNVGLTKKKNYPIQPECERFSRNSHLVK